MSKKEAKDEKKPIYKKWWFWVIIVILLVGVAGASNSKNEPTKVGDNSSESSKTDSDEKKVFAVGDVISYDGKEITVTSVKRNYDTGNEYIKPDTGKEYIKVSIKIENKSEEKISYNVFDWEVQDSDGDIQGVASIQYSTDGALNSGDLAAGGKKSGDLYFEVPKDDKNLTLHYKSSFWTDKTVDIKL